MTESDREGMVARVRALRRLMTIRNRPDGHIGDPPPDQPANLEARVAHLERLVEGLQDSVHRESQRHAKLIVDLQSQVEPGAMGAALADDARQRGL